METPGGTQNTLPAIKSRLLNAFFYLVIISMLFAAVALLTDSEAETVTDRAHLEIFDFSARIAILPPQIFQRYPYALYDPQDFAAGSVTQPEPWGSGNPPFVTYRLVLDSLAEGTVYGISGLSATHAMTLWVDGSILAQAGVPGSSRQAMTPETNSFAAYFTAGAGSTEIIKQRSSFDLFHGGRLNPLYLGDQRLITAMNILAHVRVSVIIGITLMAALFFLGVFLFFKNQMRFFWFFMVCLTVALRTLGIDLRLMATLLPGLDWHLDYLIGYWSTSAFVVFVFLYIDAVFRKPGLNRLLLRGVIAVLSAHAVFILLADSLVYSVIQIPYNITIILCSMAVLVNAAWIMIRNPEKRQTEHLLVLFGTAANMALGFAEVAIRNASPPTTANYTQAGTMVFMFVNTVVLVLYFRRTENELAAANEQRRRLQAEEAQLAADKAALERVNHLKTELMRTVSHEMRTPLAVMMGFAELSAESIRKRSRNKTYKDEETAESFDIIAAEARRMTILMEELSTPLFIRDASKDKREISVGAVVQKIAALYEKVLERKNVTLRLEAPENLPAVYCNEHELTQVLFNLLRNADKHTEQGAIAINVELTGDGEFIMVNVNDTGAGIDAEILPALFSRGVSGEKGGMGFGLAICKDIIEAHGGKI
ncbi:MAG: sensor histidine kinase, partial [Treponema sp.]|nr:sensor histidine kinase [Treponema sp.]